MLPRTSVWSSGRSSRKHRRKPPALIESLENRQLLSLTLINTPPEVLALPNQGFVAEGRIGKVGPATFEGDLSPSTSGPFAAEQMIDLTSDNDWGNGQAKSFELDVVGNEATWELAGGNQEAITFGVSPGATDLRFRAVSYAPSLSGPVSQVRLANLTLTQLDAFGNPTGMSESIDGDVVSTYLSGQTLKDVVAPEFLSGNFRLSGEATMTWDASAGRPTNSRMSFQISTAQNVILNSLTVQETQDPSNVVTAVDQTIPVIHLTRDAQHNVQVTLSALTTPDNDPAKGAILYTITDDTGTPISSMPAGGLPVGASSTITFAAPVDGMTFNINAGFDRNHDGVLQSGEITRFVAGDATTPVLTLAVPPNNVTQPPAGRTATVSFDVAANNPATGRPVKNTTLTLRENTWNCATVHPQGSNITRFSITITSDIAPGTYTVHVHDPSDPQIAALEVTFVISAP